MRVARSPMEKLKHLKERLSQTEKALEDELKKYPRLAALPRQPARVKSLKENIHFTKKEIAALEWQIEARSLLA